MDIQAGKPSIDLWKEGLKSTRVGLVRFDSHSEPRTIHHYMAFGNEGRLPLY
jgi:hypothetical protein